MSSDTCLYEGDTPDLRGCVSSTYSEYVVPALDLEHLGSGRTPVEDGGGQDLVPGKLLPGVDGIAPMCILPSLADLPVIFVSACAGGDTIARGPEAGRPTTS